MGWIHLRLTSLLNIAIGVSGMNLDPQNLFRVTWKLTHAIENATIYRNSAKPPTQNVIA